MYSKLFEYFTIVSWSALWFIGGLFLAAFAFKLPRRERLIVGIALGLVLQAWFSNLMAYLMPVPYSFWAGAFLVFGFGIFCVWPFSRQNWRDLFSISVWQVVILTFLLYLFVSIGRGLDIFDDFQNLPVTSIMAAGDIPPHFPFDPSLRFGYHYLLLLFSAQWMRLGDIYPWNSMDIARAFALALLLMLAYLWIHRMTRSKIAGFLGAIFVAFAGGARWLLLILPVKLTSLISGHIALMGSGLPTAPDLATALTAIWKIEGDGPIRFPFAYANGVNAPATAALGGIGVLGILVFLLITMLVRRVHDLKTGFVIVALWAAYALTGEYTFMIVYPSIGLTLLVYWFQTRRISIPRSFLPILVIGSVALFFAMFQGGVLTEIVRGIFAPAGNKESFHTFTFTLSAPTLVSAHLGFMSLLDPYALIVALFEFGPILLVLPLLVVWGWKMVRAGQWWEAGVAASAVLSIFSLFVRYTGTAGESANTRLIATLIIPPTLYAIPLFWNWLKKRGENLRIVSASAAFVSVFGGLVFFGIQLIAIQKPALPLFMNELDVQMEKRYWNQLAPGVMLFDPNPLRVVTVFGRGTNAMTSWTLTPEWTALAENPSPKLLHEAGYDYIYFGIDEWEAWLPDKRAMLQSDCVRLVDEVEGIHSEEDYRKDFRRLLDIRNCK